MQRLDDFLIGINQQRIKRGRRNNILLLAALQIFGGYVLYTTDYTRGTPLIIQQSGIITMPVFSALVLIAGLALGFVGLFFLEELDTVRVMFFMLPFVAYVCFSLHGVLTGQFGAQAVFFICILFLIAMNGIWMTDGLKDRA